MTRPALLLRHLPLRPTLAQFRPAIHFRTITTSPTTPAKTLPITAHGPPPSPPQKPSPISPRPNKRFWKTASPTLSADKSHYTINLDSRSIKTPLLNPLLIPASKPLLAFAIATEWEAAHTIAEARSSFRMPLTQMTSRIIDIEHVKDEAEREKQVHEIREHCVKYLETDTLLFVAPGGGIQSKASGEKTLRECQEEAVKPVLDYLCSQVWPGINIKVVDGDEGLLPLSFKQSPATMATIREWIAKLGLWDLIALERATVAGKSFLMGARVVSGWSESGLTVGKDSVVGVGRKEIDIDEAAKGVSVEVDWQTGQWGEVEDTHDVEKEDLRRQLGSAVLLCTGTGCA